MNNVDIVLISHMLRGVAFETERQVEVPFLFKNLPDPPLKVLDVGCCETDMLSLLEGLGYDSYGIDAREYHIKYDKFYKCDARDMCFQDNFFDTSVAVSTLEHIGLVDTPYKTDMVYDELGDYKVINEMKRITKKSGYLIITIPYMQKHPSFSNWIRFYDKERINLLMEKVKILDIRYYIYLINSKVNNYKLFIETNEITASQAESIGAITAVVCILAQNDK